MGGSAAPDTEREGTRCRACPFPPQLLALGCCLWLCAGSGLCHRACVQAAPTAVGSAAVPGVRVRKRLCWLLGTVQARTCSGQRLVNDSFVGAWSGWDLLMMVMCRAGRDAGKYPAREKIGVWVRLKHS